MFPAQGDETLVGNNQFNRLSCALRTRKRGARQVVVSIRGTGDSLNDGIHSRKRDIHRVKLSPDRRRVWQTVSSVGLAFLSLRAESFALGKKDVLPGAGLGYRCTRVYRTRDLRSVRYGTEPHRHH